MIMNKFEQYINNLKNSFNRTDIGFKHPQYFSINLKNKPKINAEYSIFYDYDGKELYTYTKDKFLTLTSLPELPSHDGLICQGWNYTLEDAKAYVQEYGKLDIGATYITDDNKTRLYIKLENDGISVPLYINQTVDNGVTVEWGDGNSETISGTGNKTFNHTYAKAGSYTISLTVNSGTCALGYNSSSYNVMGSYNTVASGSLYKVEIGSNMNISSYAFEYCYNLQSVAISDSVTEIGNYAFNACISLQSITIPNSVTSIGGNTFYNCFNLQSITIPNSVTMIDNSAFQYCHNLQSITIPNSVTEIGERAFRYCFNLQSITIPDSVNEIGEYTFQNCYNLQSITIPNSVTTIGQYAFVHCQSLQSITIPDSVTSIGNFAFQNCYNLQNITIPDSVKSIGEHAFYSCRNLQSITIPNSVTSIGYETFLYCYVLQSITIPDSVKTIGKYAFYGCYSLQSITIPNSVTEIGNNAFDSCRSLQYYDFTTYTSVPTISNANTFDGISTGCEIRVPAALYEEWKAATNWSTYADYIVMDMDVTEYTSLNITADDVSGRKTNTTIYWEAVANGINKYTGEIVTGIRLTGTDVSDEFDQNTSTTDTVTRTITYSKYGLTATTTITQGVWIDQSYTIDLNSNWQLSSTIANPDSSLYDGVYESFSNKGVNSTAAIMYIDIVGYTDFSLYIRSYAESNYDYVMVSQLDQTINNDTSYSNTTLVKDHTRGTQTSNTAISNYKLVEFTDIDGGKHRITIVYRKDSGGASGDDQGYLIIPKQ